MYCVYVRSSGSRYGLYLLTISLEQAYNGIMNIPALVLLKDGQKVDMNIGFVPKDAVKDFVSKNL